MEGIPECFVSYKIFDNSDQENKCLKKHPVCNNYLSKWIFKFQNNRCPFCRKRIFLFRVWLLQEARVLKRIYRAICADYQGFDSFEYLCLAKAKLINLFSN